MRTEPRKPRPTFAESMAKAEAKYGTYDPKKEGYGKPREWKSFFEKIMGLGEAEELLGADDPLSILGFKVTPPFDLLKRRYRQLMMKNHPDRGGNTEKAQKIIAAFTKIKYEIENEMKSRKRK